MNTPRPVLPGSLHVIWHVLLVVFGWCLFGGFWWAVLQQGPHSLTNIVWLIGGSLVTLPVVTSLHHTLAIDAASSRPLRVTQMIGFEDWTDPGQAHTKRFHTEQYDHWAWYRIPDVSLTPGKHRLTLAVGHELGTAEDARESGGGVGRFPVLPRRRTEARGQQPLLDRHAVHRSPTVGAPRQARWVAVLAIEVL